MHEHRDDDALSDDVLDREIKRALAVNPSPAFVPRLRTRLASEPLPRWQLSWTLAVAAATLTAAASIMIAVRSARHPASTLAVPMPLGSRDQSAALRAPIVSPQNRPDTQGAPSLPNLSSFKPSSSTGRSPTRPAPLAGDAHAADSATIQALSVAEPLRAGRDVRAPRKMLDVKPVYPQAARAAKAEGVVVVEALIAIDGSVSRARIVSSIPLLDQAALDAVMQWTFEPTRLNGRPVTVVMNVFINFTLN